MQKIQDWQILVFGVLLFLSFFIGNSVLADSAFININNRDSVTRVRSVFLDITAPEGARQMKISNDGTLYDADWEPVATGKTWFLEYGSGTQTVYIKFKDASGNISQTYQDIIQLSPAKDLAVEFEINDGAKETFFRQVTLNIKYTPGTEGMIISNSNNFTGLSFSDVSESAVWALTEGSGQKTVYMQFKDSAGKIKTVSDIIKYTEPANYINDGTLLKGQGSTIYYLGEDYKLHPFSNSMVFHSWYSNFSKVKYVGNAKLREYEIGNTMCVRPGTWLLKFNDGPIVYAVEPGCKLRPILSEAQAYLLYGANWTKKIIELDAVERSVYQVRTYDATNKDKAIVDRDRDGVNAIIEKQQGTSDVNSDTDNDGLTDYEEIFYWFSDPVLADTDADGYKDGKEIATGFNPFSTGKLKEIPEGTYRFPYGTFFSTTAGNYYYVGVGGKYYATGSSKNLNILNANGFLKNFVNNPPLKLNFTLTNAPTLGNDVDNIERPMIYAGNRLQRL